MNVSSMSGRRVASAALSTYSGTKFAVHAIAAPRDVTVYELALYHVDQD